MSILLAYDNYLEEYKKGNVTEQEWQEFCFTCLEELCKANEKILKNLKNT